MLQEESEVMVSPRWLPMSQGHLIACGAKECFRGRFEQSFSSLASTIHPIHFHLVVIAADVVVKGTWGEGW